MKLAVFSEDALEHVVGVLDARHIDAATIEGEQLAHTGEPAEHAVRTDGVLLLGEHIENTVEASSIATQCAVPRHVRRIVNIARSGATNRHFDAVGAVGVFIVGTDDQRARNDIVHGFLVEHPPGVRIVFETTAQNRGVPGVGVRASEQVEHGPDAVHFGDDCTGRVARITIDELLGRIEPRNVCGTRARELGLHDPAALRVLTCANGIETGAIKRSARFEGDLGDGVQILEHVDVAHARCLPVPVGQVQGAQRRATVEEVVERSGVAGEQRRIEVSTIE